MATITITIHDANLAEVLEAYGTGDPGSRVPAADLTPVEARLYEVIGQDVRNWAATKITNEELERIALERADERIRSLEPLDPRVPRGETSGSEAGRP